MKKFFFSLFLTLLLELNLLASIQTLVVLPFANVPKNHNLHWISESFPELLQDRLRWPNLNVLGREERLIAFDRIGIPYPSLLSKASMIRIGQELDSDLLILGDFNFDGKRLEASASILDLRKILLSAVLKEEGALEDLQPICSRLAWQILKTIDPTFPLSRNAFVSRFPLIPNIALENYIRGLLESNRTKQVRFFRQADKAYVNYSKAIFQLGKLYHQAKDYSTSSLWLQRLIKLDSHFLEAHFLLGLNHLYLKNYDKAVTEFKQLSQLIPLNEVYNNLGIALSFSGLNDKATSAFQKAIEGDPSEADYYFNLAYHFWRTGNFTGAVKNLQEVLLKEEEDGEAHYLRYKCLQAIGKPTEADAAWALAKQFSPKVESWEDRRKTPDLFRIQSNFDELSFRQLQLEIQHVQHSKIIGISHTEKIAGYLNQAQACFELNQWDRALQTLAQAIQISPESAEAHLLMGRVLEAKGEKLRAISEFRSSLWLQESIAARVLLSRLYLSLDRKKEAQAEAQLALDLEPGNREAQEILTQISQ